MRCRLPWFLAALLALVAGVEGLLLAQGARRLADAEAALADLQGLRAAPVSEDLLALQGNLPYPQEALDAVGAGRLEWLEPALEALAPDARAGLRSALVQHMRRMNTIAASERRGLHAREEAGWFEERERQRLRRVLEVMAGPDPAARIWSTLEENGFFRSTPAPFPAGG